MSLVYGSSLPLFVVGLRLHKEPIPEKIAEPKEAESKPEGEPKREEAPANADADAENQKTGTEGDAEDDLVDGETNSEVIDRLCKYVYTKGSDRVRTRAMLCHIYNHALHDRLYEARDLMLISHLQEEIQHSDIPTQVSRCLSAQEDHTNTYFLAFYTFAFAYIKVFS